MRFVQKIKEFGVGMLMLGTSAAALLGGTNEENYDIHPDQIRMEMLTQLNPRRRAVYEQGDLSQLVFAEEWTDRNYFIWGKAMLADGKTSVSKDDFGVTPTDKNLKQIEQQYKMLENNFSKQELHQARENYFKVWEKAGKPTFVGKKDQSWTTELETKFINDPNRACYNSVINEIYNPLGIYKDQMAEMAHAVYQKRSSQFFGVLWDKITHPMTDQTETYNMVDLTEFNTHSCVEPVLHDVIKGDIPFDKMDVEIDRRLAISEKLSDANIEYMEKKDASEMIGDISDLFAQKGMFDDGEKAFGNASRFQYSLVRALEWKRLAGSQGELVTDADLVSYQLFELKNGNIRDQDAFFDGLEDMKETLTDIQDDDEMKKMAIENEITAQDIARLTKTEGKEKIDLASTMKNRNQYDRISDVFAVAKEKMGENDISPKLLKTYFQVRDICLFVPNEKQPELLGMVLAGCDSNGNKNDSGMEIAFNQEQTHSDSVEKKSGKLSLKETLSSVIQTNEASTNKKADKIISARLNQGRE